MIKSPDGKPLPNIKVEAFGERKPDTAERPLLSTATTRTDGRFALAADTSNVKLLALSGPDGTGRIALKPSRPANEFVYPVKTTIAIVHDNDMHFDYNYGDRVDAYLEEARQHYDNVLLFNAGDVFNRHPGTWGGDDGKDPANYARNAKHMIEQLNKHGYQALTPGNHELDFIDEHTRTALELAEFPILSANLDKQTDLLPEMRPYHIFTLENDQTIAVLGLSTGRKKEGLTILSAFDTAEKYAHLADKHTLFVGLTHIGIANDLKLAERRPEFDIIIGAHSHTLLSESIMVNGILVAQAGGAGHAIKPTNPKFLGLVEVEMENDRVASKKGSVINLARPSPIAAQWDLFPQRGKPGEAVLRIINPSFQDIELTAKTGVENAESSRESNTLIVKARDSAAIPYIISPAHAKKGSLTLIAELYTDPAQNPIETLKVEVNLLPKVSNISIDGSLDDWESQGWWREFAAAQATKGPAQGPPPDMSGKMVMGWNESGLLIGVEVNDKQHFSVKGKKGAWVGDAVEFALAQPAKRNIPAISGNDLTASFYINQSGPQLKTNAEGSELKKLNFSITRGDTDAKTVYEWIVPLDYMGLATSPGAGFIANMAVLDDDNGEGVSSYYQLNKGMYPKLRIASMPVFMLSE